MGVGPETVVNPPLHKTPDGSLVAASSYVEESADSRWESGFTFQPDGCVQAVAWDPCAPIGEPERTKADYDGNQEPVDYQPFIVVVPYECSTFGFQAADYEGKALRSLDRSFHKAIEREFWLGEKISSNQSLVGSTPNDDNHILNIGGAANPAAVSPASALILLTQALADCGSGSLGMIHATPGLVEAWMQQHLINKNESGQLVTGVRGDIVVAGAGYTGDGPTGQGAITGTEQWAYVTGLVDVRLGEPTLWPTSIAEATDRATNTVVFRGEMSASVTHDGCCMFAVLVDTEINVPLGVTGDLGITVNPPASVAVWASTGSIQSNGGVADAVAIAQGALRIVITLNSANGSVISVLNVPGASIAVVQPPSGTQWVIEATAGCYLLQTNLNITASGGVSQLVWHAIFVD